MLALSALIRACLDGVYDGRCELLEAPMVEDLCALASDLPGTISWAGFECRLLEEEARVDFGICVEEASASDLLPKTGAGCCQRTLKNWLALEPSLRSAVPRAMIEFDRPDVARHQDTASPWDSAFAFFRVASPSGVVSSELVHRLLTALTSGTAHVAPPAASIAAATPSGAEIMHLAVLDHRQSLETRLHYAIRSDQLPELWSRVMTEAPETEQLLRALLSGLPIPRFAVQSSDVGGGFQPYSLEIALPHDSFATPIWRALLERLVSAGLASKPKIEALLRWPGESTLQAAEESGALRVRRGFNVTLRLGQSPAAKGYPYFHCGHA